MRTELSRRQRCVTKQWVPWRWTFVVHVWSFWSEVLQGHQADQSRCADADRVWRRVILYQTLCHSVSRVSWATLSLDWYWCRCVVVVCHSLLQIMYVVQVTVSVRCDTRRSVVVTIAVMFKARWEDVFCLCLHLSTLLSSITVVASILAMTVIAYWSLEPVAELDLCRVGSQIRSFHPISWVASWINIKPSFCEMSW